MQDTSKLMLTIVAGGVLMGAWLGQLASPVMQFAPEPEWRTRLTERFEANFSASPLQFVDAGPQDLNPFGWTPGMMTSGNIAINVAPPEPALPEPIEAALDEASAAAEALEDSVVSVAPPQPMMSASLNSLPSASSEPSVPAESSLQ